jgi:hypothetical protein
VSIRRTHRDDREKHDEEEQAERVFLMDGQLHVDDACDHEDRREDPEALLFRHCLVSLVEADEPVRPGSPDLQPRTARFTGGQGLS